MPQHLKVQLTITLDGIDANEVLDVLAQSAIDGELDQAILNLVRAHLAPWQPPQACRYQMTAWGGFCCETHLS